MLPLRYTLGSLWVRRATTLFTVLGLGLVVFILAAALMLSEGIQRTMTGKAAPTDVIVIRQGSVRELSSSLTVEKVQRILAGPGIRLDANQRPLGQGELITIAFINKTDGGSSNLFIRGVTAGSLTFRPGVHIVAGRIARPGTDEAMIGRGLVGRFEGLALGQSIKLTRNRALQIVGVFDDDGGAAESELWADLDWVRTTFGRAGTVSAVHVRLTDAAAVDKFRAYVAADPTLGAEAIAEGPYEQRLAEGSSQVVVGAAMILTIFFGLAATLGAMITMYSSVFGRTPEIAVMLVLGFSRRAVLASFLFEGALLALIGAGLGVIGALALSHVEMSMMNYATWTELVFHFQPTSSSLVTAVIIGVVMGLVGGVLPAIRAARISPLAAMRRGT
ncbi:MAG TPA: ABC transporter permease [Kofleriaceae bacterium]|nr:ABC transporter permease [Kofleriaceae bacterium]